MKLYLYPWIICLLWANYVNSQEIFGEQIWELTEDINKDGWVDQGDIVSFQVNITYNGESAATISIENLLEHSGLELKPSTVTITKGTIIQGDNSLDSLILIEDVILAASWGYTTLLFSAKITSDPNQEITNHTTLITSIGSITTNRISLPRRTDYSMRKSILNYPSIAIGLIIIIALVIICFKKSKDSKVQS